MRNKWVCFVLVFSLVGLSWAQKWVVSSDVKTGVYAVGAKVTWNLELQGGTAEKASYVVKRDGYTVIQEGAVTLTEGKGTVEATLDRPGSLLLELTAQVGDRAIKGFGGATFSPERISPVLPRPWDFDSFWSSKIAELNRIPSNPSVVKTESGQEGIGYFKVTLDGYNGSKIHGQMAKPARGGKFPAFLIVQWAGVYPLQKDWVTGRASAGWLTLNIMAHDLPFDREPAFYEAASKNELNNYPAIGNESRETSYFLRMYLSCYRAAEFLSKRPDWDGKTLVVYGGSQGGMQSIVTTAIHPKITAAIASVPAGSDLNGPARERAPGWPMWYWQTQGKDADKVRAAAPYFDVVNFAQRVRCPVLIGVGLIDTTCPPSGISAMANQLRGRKELVIMPNADHMGPHGPYYERSETWIKSLQTTGKPPS